MRSFGWVEGGPSTVLEGLLAEGCTMMVPTFSSDAFEVPPPPNAPKLARNGHHGAAPEVPKPGPKGVYTPDANDLDLDMGAIPAAVLATPGRARGPHRLRSCAAVGPRARDLIPEGGPDNLFAPFDRLAELGGWLLLMGVGLHRATVVHQAEVRAGRRMFVRWANGPGGTVVQAEVGGCSDGFVSMDPILAPIERRTTVGESLWRAFPVREVLETVSKAFREQPSISHCGDAACIRCEHAVAGGPVAA